MKRGLIAIVAILFFFQFISCNDELVVDQKELNNSTDNLTLTKEGDLLSTLQDSISLKDKKAKVLRLKQEHEKPYVVIEKPEKLLAEKLKSRTPNKTIDKSSTNSKLNSVQGAQSCYTLEIDVWALEKYIPKTGFNIGICPKSDWMYNQNTLSELKNKWGYRLIMLEKTALISQSIYPINQIVVCIDGLHPKWVENDYLNFQPRSLYGFYMDEPAHSLDPAMRDSVSKIVTNLKAWGFTNSIYMAGETCDVLADKVDDLVDIINNSGYTDYSYNILCGCFNYLHSSDQRDEWTDYNTLFGQKFNHLWISGASDRGEMNLLTGHAKNMNKNCIWLYAGEMDISNESYWDAIYEFNYYSFKNNFITREERRFIYVYNYIGNDDPCYDYQITSWDLIDIIDTGELTIR
jgi:hypothetical protein